MGIGIWGGDVELGGNGIVCAPQKEGWSGITLNDPAGSACEHRNTGSMNPKRVSFLSNFSRAGLKEEIP